ncbi:MAG TPA: hypothetical protein VGE38_00045 [Nocardioides sp.]|uniref:hypothetical protein n=1 Tax=Nocardioides sp. TaxID=35761 RepID=UPI002ED96494
MGDLLSRLEIVKLAREVQVPEADLEFLVASDPTEIRQLRAQVSDALFARHEDRVTRLASLSRLLPVPMTAKIAELALGPMLSARVAAALDPREAARLAGHLDAGFLTTLAVSLDPKRVAAIVRGIDDKLVVDVGRRLLAKGEYLVLSRFVSVVDTDVALAVVASATPDALLQVALFTDEPAALDSIVARLSDETLADIIRAAADADAYDAAVTLLLALSTESCSRLVAQVHAVAPQARDALVAAVAEHDVWPAILPALHTVEQQTLGGLVNVAPTMDVALIDRVVQHARELDVAPVLVQMVLALDDEHLDVLKGSRELGDPAVQSWLLRNAGVAGRLVEAVLDNLQLRSA